MANYEIRIYDLSCDDLPLNKWNKPEELNTFEPDEVYYSETKEELLERWREIIELCEGYPYMIIDNMDDECIVAGSCDFSDQDILKEYFKI